MNPDLILCLDTSSDAGVALYRDGQVLSARRSATDRRHAETLIPMVQDALAEAGRDVSDVDAVVVGTGPAPFTGLRAGLATAQAFAQARDIDVAGVCSLDALALAAGTGEVLVVSDARRRELYYARYQVDDQDVRPTHPPAVAAPEQIVAEHADLIRSGQVHGPGLVVAADRLGLGPEAAHGPATDPVDPVNLARIAIRRRVTGGDLSVTPRYLRRPDVHPGGARKRVR